MNKASGEKKSAMAIEVKSFIQAAAVIVALMIAAGALTKVIPSGSFKRIVEGGRTLVMDGTYARRRGRTIPLGAGSPPQRKSSRVRTP
jgi:uncharacterized ion transporter superfamily protein YfcC